MSAKSDPQLLREYAGSRSEAAFEELVQRHLDLVHSAAVRITGDVHLAKDVSQGVFLALAKNAGKLAVHPVLSGWLHSTTRNIAAQAIRGEARRRNRERQAAAMNDVAGTCAAWDEIAPVLEAALAELPESDRDAVLLRYFENRSATDMAAILGISAEAAQKRVNRGVGKLREKLAKRGVAAGIVGIAEAISANAVQAAPTGLVANVLSGAVDASIFGNTKPLAMVTMKKALAVAVVTILAAAVIRQARSRSHATEHWRSGQGEVLANRKTREGYSLAERMFISRGERPLVDREKELVRLKQRWLEVGSANERVPEQNALAKESAALLMCAPEMLDLLDFLTRNGFGYGVAAINSEVLALFDSTNAAEARELLVHLPETTRISGERSYASGTEPYRDRWSYAAGKTCPDDEFTSFCSALNCKSCAVEALYGRNERLMATDPQAAFTSSLETFKFGIPSISGRYGVTRLFEVQSLPDIDFKKFEEQLPREGPEEVGPLPTHLEPSAFTEIRRKLFWAWAKLDPAEAANHVMANPDRLSPRLMEEIVGGCSNKDGNGIISWVASIPEGPYFDAAARSAACYARGYPGIDDLIGKIQDPKLRKEAMERAQMPLANPNTR